MRCGGSCAGRSSVDLRAAVDCAVAAQGCAGVVRARGDGKCVTAALLHQARRLPAIDDSFEGARARIHGGELPHVGCDDDVAMVKVRRAVVETLVVGFVQRQDVPSCRRRRW